MSVRHARREKMPEPVWDIAHLFPPQGHWSEEEYLELNSNRFIEFDDGTIEVLPMPTTSHQLIVLYLCRLLAEFVEPRDLGTVLVAVLRVRLWPGKYREPDIVFMEKRHANRIKEEYWDGADLVVEVVSPGLENRQRDLRQKRRDYAKAGIPEYWIVDPEKQEISVLKLSGTKYVVAGRYKAGDDVQSARWPEFQVDVADVFRAGKRPRG